MTKTLREELYSKVDLGAQRKKEEIDYIFGIIEDPKYNPRLIELFGQNEEGKFTKQYLEKKVFEGTKRTIDSIEEYGIETGFRVYRGNPKKSTFPVGFLEWVEIKTKAGYRCLKPSKEGLEILNDLREIRGQFSVEETNEKIRKMRFPSQYE